MIHVRFGGVYVVTHTRITLEQLKSISPSEYYWCNTISKMFYSYSHEEQINNMFNFNRDEIINAVEEYKI